LVRGFLRTLGLWSFGASRGSKNTAGKMPARGCCVIPYRIRKAAIY